MTARQAIGYMNYPGEPMWPVSAAYDATADSTRVGFSLIAPEVVA